MAKCKWCQGSEAAAAAFEEGMLAVKAERDAAIAAWKECMEELYPEDEDDVL